MFESIYLGLSGLSAFSRNLTVIGNNVANLNTPGFKASEMSFTDLAYEDAFPERNNGDGAQLQVGSGVGAGSTRMLFTQGTVQTTGNPTDLAIDGGGFFVLRSGDQTTYTRAGNFTFDKDGFLVAQNGARVAALQGGALADLGIASLGASPPKATSVVHFADNLSSGGSSASVNVTVFDASGGSHALTVNFTNNSSVTPQSWLVEVRDENNVAIGNGEIRFNGDGSPADGFNSLAFTLKPAGGASPGTITLDFGAAGQFSGTTNFSAGTDSTLKAGSQDGFAAGALTGIAFDAQGVAVASYSNGQSARGGRLALAFFANPEQLDPLGDASFANRSAQAITLGSPGEGVFGNLKAGALESANVDLSQEFGDLIITQRGYQASSQVVSAANDMVQQLLDMRSQK